MTYKDKYNDWLKKADSDTIKELEAIKGNEKEIEDRFYKTLDFGTAGLRGVMGAGTNRMNKYVIGQTTQALARYVIEQGMEKRGAVIAYDCRIKSDEYAKQSATVLAANGIKVYLYESLRSTPQLSYSIRKLNAATGINITASHNPKQYNGYKVYWEEGSQILDDIADAIAENISRIDPFNDVKTVDFDKAVKSGQITMLGKDMDDMFIEEVLSLTLNDDIDKDVKIVYTPLYGTGLVPVTRILRERGFHNVTVVEEQKEPDGTFPTTPYPNPENVKVFEIPLKYGKKTDADMIIASDPDCDRIAMMIKNDNNEFVFCTGNQTGALLAEYMLSQRKEKGLYSPKDAVVQSIVSGSVVPKIAKHYGTHFFETLTGFKYICGLANEFEKTGEYRYVFGYEESIGYCIETFTRDKNGVSAAMMMCEMAGYYKKRGITLYEVLTDIYEKYGYMTENQISVEYPGIKGAKIKKHVMSQWRKKPLLEISGIKCSVCKDYINGYEGLPAQDALKYEFEDGSWYALRPSGTEPKLKVYINAMGHSRKEADDLVKVFTEDISDYLAKCEK